MADPPEPDDDPPGAFEPPDPSPPTVVLPPVDVVGTRIGTVEIRMFSLISWIKSGVSLSRMVISDVVGQKL